MGETKTEEILLSTVKCKAGLDVFIWKPSINNTFSTTSAWEVTKKRGEQNRRMEWSGRIYFPKKSHFVCEKLCFITYHLMTE